MRHEFANLELGATISFGTCLSRMEKSAKVSMFPIEYREWFSILL